MASDNPYPLDPFTIIKSINFGGGIWCVALVGSSPQIVGGFINGHGPPSYADVAGSVAVDFSGIAGGTPGFTLIQDITPIAGAKTSPYAIQKADLTKPIRTAAGAGLIGFTVSLVTIQQALNPPFTKFHLPIVALFLQCTGVLAKQFRVRLTGIATNTNTQGLMQVGIFGKNVIKAGVLVDLKNNTPTVTSGAEKGYGKPNAVDNVVADFIVDPKSLTVSGPL